MSDQTKSVEERRSETRKREASYQALRDLNLFEQGRRVLLDAKSGIENLEDAELRASIQLTYLINLLNSAKNTKRLAAAMAAEKNLGDLADMAASLAKKYEANAESLRQNAAESNKSKTTNGVLAALYFTVSVGKVTDVIAQFYAVGKVKELAFTNKYTGLNLSTQFKTVTNIKTPLTDIGKEAMKGSKLNPHLVVAQSVNAFLTARTGADLKSLEDGIRSIIESVKDIVAIAKGPKDPKLFSGDIRRNLISIGEQVAKFLDLANRIATLTEIVDPLPAKNAIGDSLSPAKKYLSAAKYALEAILSFCQGCMSACDAWDAAKAEDDAGYAASRQTYSSGGGKFDPDLLFFAQATHADLIKIIHNVKSVADGRQMQQIATDQLLLLRWEFGNLTGRLASNQKCWELLSRIVAEKRAKLGQVENEMEKVAERLRKGRDNKQYVVEELLHDIEEMQFKISHILAPHAPQWIATHGRFGARISPM